MRKVRTRIAPSPTGPVHCGNLRTALFNYLFAKKNGGDFLLRIEDTDKDRFVEGAEKYIIDSLAWCGIKFDDGINPDGTAKYVQSKREYRSYADKLVASGHAYYAFDTKEELEAMRKSLEDSGANNTGYHHWITKNNSLHMSPEDVKSKIDSGAPYVIRFKIPADTEIKFTDLVRGDIVFNSNDLDDKVIFKADGLPTYHLAHIVDDYLMGITHVIRGDEWVSSAPLHMLIYDAFGWDRPALCQLPLILGPDGKKLSKRHGDKYGFPVFPMTWDYVNENGENVHVTGFKHEGYEPDALINFLALLGWNPGGDKEIMSMDEMIDLFSLDRINNSGAMFDVEKLKNFNAHYMRSRDFLYLFENFIEPNAPRDKDIFDIKHNGVYEMPKAEKIENIAKERATFAKDLYQYVSYFFEPVILKDDVVLKNPEEFKEVMGDLLDYCVEPFEFTAENIKKHLEMFCNNRGYKIGKIMPDLRLALTGGIPGPHLDETMEILGKAESIKRIKALIEKTEKVAG